MGGTILLAITGWWIARLLLRALTINRSVVVVGSLFTVVIGIYSLNYRMFDVWVCFVFGVIGYFMLRYGYSVAAAALAVVLAAGLESSLRRGMSLFHNDAGQFLGRPITAIILTAALVFLVIGLRRTVRFAREARRAEAKEAAAPSETPVGGGSA
jgi:putative tricarboxylic transport membrane protein